MPLAITIRESHFHVEAALSIDEMWVWRPYNLREPATVEAIGKKIKATVARDVSPVIKVSRDAAPMRISLHPHPGCGAGGGLKSFPRGPAG